MLTADAQTAQNALSVFSTWESEVRSYCRDFPVMFAKASGHTLTDVEGRTYIDFLAGAGALNYGHNHPELRREIVGYLQSDGIVHSLDLHTERKRDFILEMQETILAPRHLNYKIQFTGPTGTNSVEAALKLARRVTKRVPVVAFTNSFHGMSIGSLAASSSRKKRAAAGLPLTSVERLPYDGYLGAGIDTNSYIEKLLDDPGSGFDLPAAFIVETVQAEGGLFAASPEWLQRLRQTATRHGILLIVDEIQTGCGRTGPFFSFERAGIVPDMVCLSKSIGGFGLPMAILLIKPELDTWEPGQHNGTFRGNNLAFVAGAAALRLWRDGELQKSVETKGQLLRRRLLEIASNSSNTAEVRGHGLLQGIAFQRPSIATNVSRLAFSRGLIVETCGSRDDVLKVMPPLTIPEEALDEGISIIAEAVDQERRSGGRLASHS
jgi:diaminobutyrate-2-oxoglutarate transaminase